MFTSKKANNKLVMLINRKKVVNEKKRVEEKMF